MIKELDLFRNHEEECIRNAVVSIEELLESDHQMSKDEIMEIIDDILTLEQIDVIADDIDRKVKVEETFNIIKNIISVIPF